MSEWYSIDSRTPKPLKTVLVRIKGDDNNHPNYFEDRIDKDGIWKQAIDGRVSHWTYLPEGCPTCGHLE